MNRIKEYICFAICFAGLGYIALWPVTSPDLGGQPFGASILCGDATFGSLDFLCHSALPLQLPPNLHVLGFLSALFVIVRLLLRALQRSRRAAANRAAVMAAQVTQQPDAAPPARRKPLRRLRPVKPRAHFGLRGAPR
ncbi:MAG: hypothetical protein HY244_08730 [Rhizobiales bacterium]|nr:hypothetical protein [Hyphomicrobiales bacterium]